MRGEQVILTNPHMGMLGSPPRARGAVILSNLYTSEHGITPACAGSRRQLWTPAGYTLDHPRVRGEQEAALVGAGLW